MPELPTRFEPLRRTSRARRIALYIGGPLLWVLSFGVVDYVVRDGREIRIALVILAASFLLASAVLLPMRYRRVREEAERP
jgi:membrane protein YdbS with pleckstrin-like domain